MPKGLLVASMTVAIGCGGRPEGPSVRGMLAADTPLVTPIEGARACVFSISWVTHTRGRMGSGGATPPRYAPGLRLVSGNRRLRVRGDCGPGDPMCTGWLGAGLKMQSWGATMDLDAAPPVPGGLWGLHRDLDQRLARVRGLADRPPGGALTRLEVTELFVPCGTPITVTGRIAGDVLTLGTPPAR